MQANGIPIIRTWKTVIALWAVAVFFVHKFERSKHINEYDSNFEFPVIDDGTEFDWDSLFQPQEPTAPVVTLNPAKKMSVVQTKKNGEQAIIAKDRAKNKASCRSLPLVPQFRELLLKMKAHQQYCAELCGDCYTHSDYIFVNDIGQPYNPNYITQHFALILEKNNLRKIRYHELRHSCASLLLKNRVSMSEIQSWLGHSTYTATANFYAHLDTGANDKTGQAMADTLDISVSLCDQPRNMITNRCRRA